jgi:phage gp45-like
MGLKTFLLSLKSSVLKEKGSSPGKTAVMVGNGVLDQSLEVEILQQPGVFSLPADGISGIFIPVGTSDVFGGVLCFKHPKTNLDVGGSGGSCIFSTNSTGDEVKSIITLKPSGDISINGDTKSFVTFQELQDALNAVFTTISNHVHPSNGSPSSSLVGLACDISASKTTTIKTGG